MSWSISFQSSHFLMKCSGSSLISDHNKKGCWHLMENYKEPAHVFLVSIAHAKSHSLSVHCQLPSGARCLNFGLSIYLQPLYVCACSEGSGETDVPRSTSYGVYISQLIRFARASCYVADFNTRNKLLTQKLLKQGYRYHKLRKTFSKFYRRYYDLISKFQVGLKSLLRQGLSEPDFYGDLVYKLKKIVGSNHFSAQFIKIISHYKKIGYNINVLQQTACLVVNPITVGNFAFLFNCTPVGRTSDSMLVPT